MNILPKRWLAEREPALIERPIFVSDYAAKYGLGEAAVRAYVENGTIPGRIIEGCLVLEDRPVAEWLGYRRMYYAKWMVAVAYFAASFFGAWWFSDYLARVGDTLKIPDVVWLLFGPVIALAMAHGVLIYFVTTLVVLPLLIATVGSSKGTRMLYLSSAVAVWLLIGHWMYAGS